MTPDFTYVVISIFVVVGFLWFILNAKFPPDRYPKFNKFMFFFQSGLFLLGVISMLIGIIKS